jgi:myo-inositol-1(or 4)-monophosphatase
MNVMIAAARKAARALSRDFGEVENLQVSRKGPSDFVSSADIKAEKTLFEELSKARPGYSFVMEERGVVEGTDKPIAGSSIRSTAPPTSCTASRTSPSRSRLEREGVLVAGVVYNVIRDELFWAEKGPGRLSQRPAPASRRAQRHARCALRHRHAVPRQAWPSRKSLGEIERVIAKTAGIRRFGAAALDLAYVAAGRLRRLLGTRPQCLGHCCRRRHRARGGRHRHRDRWRRFHEDRRDRRR